MKRAVLLMLFAAPVLLLAQGDTLSSTGGIDAVLGALALAVAQWLLGFANKAKELGIAYMDNWIKQVKKKHTKQG